MDFIINLPLSAKSRVKTLFNNYRLVKQKSYFNSDIINIYPRGNHSLYRALHSVPRVPKGDY